MDDNAGLRMQMFAWRRIKMSTIENGFGTAVYSALQQRLMRAVTRKWTLMKPDNKILTCWKRMIRIATLAASKNQMKRKITEFFCVSFELNQTLSIKLGFLTKLLN